VALTRRSGAVVVLLTGVVFSFGALFFRATDNVDAWQYLTFRGLGAFLAVTPVLLWNYRRDLGAVVRETSFSHVAAGALLGAMMISFIVSLSHADAAFVLLFQAVAPVGAAAFSWILLKERIERNAMVAAVAAVIGVVIMVSSGLDSGIGWALLVVMVIPIGFGLYSTLIRSAPSADPMVPVVIAAIVTMATGMLVSLSGPGLDVSTHDMMIGLFAGSALIGLPLPFFNHAQKVVPAPDATLLLLSEVVLGPVWVWLAFSEVPAARTLIGGAVIFSAVIWLTTQSRDAVPEPHTSRG
jgi:drug/metabolite transporter (DMT)-like permease